MIKKKFTAQPLWVLAFMLIMTTQSVHAQDGLALTKEMAATVKKIKSCQFKMKLKERLADGSYVQQQGFFKISYEPYRIYYKQTKPKAGLEVLYHKDKYGGDALINPNGFPYINLTLDPLGSAMRSGQHHPILNSGFLRIISIVEHLLAKYADQAPTLVSMQGITTLNEVVCYKITFNNPNYRLISVTPNSGETVRQVAERYVISDYKILSLNENVSQFEDIATKLTIPNDYAKSLVVYVDTIRMIPIRVEVSDELGLYEQYEFNDVHLNVLFSPTDFSEENKNYGF